MLFMCSFGVIWLQVVKVIILMINYVKLRQNDLISGIILLQQHICMVIYCVIINSAVQYLCIVYYIQ